MQGIAEAFSVGGGWMYVIAFVSVIGLGIMIERFIFLFFKYNINAKAFMGQIQKLVMANNIDRAIKLCNAAPNAALPKVIKAGLTRANKGELEIANAIEEATLEVVPYVTKRTPHFGRCCQHRNPAGSARNDYRSDSGVRRPRISRARRPCRGTCKRYFYRHEHDGIWSYRGHSLYGCANVSAGSDQKDSRGNRPVFGQARESAGIANSCRYEPVVFFALR